MNAEPDPAAGSLVPAGERGLVQSPGGLAARGLALAADLLARPAAPPPPGEIRCHRGHGDCVVSVAFSADGRFLVSGSWDGTARVWERATGAEVRRFGGHRHRVSSVAFSPDGRRVVSGGWDGTARVWEWESGADVAHFGGAGDGMVHAVAFSPDGRQVAYGGNGGELVLADVLRGATVRRVPVPRGPLRCARFAPDGRAVLTGSGQVALTGEGRDGGAVCLWDGESGALLWGWSDATEPVLAVAFAAEGRTAFSCTGWPSRSRLNVTQTWDVESGTETSRHEGHRQPVFSGAILPDGRHVLLGSRDRLVRLWDPVEAREVHRFEGHTDAVFSVAVSGDGRLGLSGSGDGTVRLWQLPAVPGS